MIFLDANYFINLSVKTNKHHERAKEIRTLIKYEEKIISNLVIMEVISVLNVRLKQSPDLLLKVYNDLNRVYRIINDTSFHGMGFEILQKEFKKNKERLPLFDCVYIAIMEELGIKKIVSFDGHFDNKENIKRIH
ncbi:MAG: type II toxin-antitoxin system VapC family toxin [Methanobrevibacter sp.]|nr:type II toxin-antitoxin system VapC family toxin [Methanobrevibacter sp.]